MHKVIRFLGSLWLTFPLLALLACVLAAGGGLISSIEFIDVTIGALRLDVYGSPWFGGLMALLMLNLVVCTVTRKPWRYWQWGFLVTHTGILTLMIGACITYYFKVYGQMPLMEGQEANRFNVEHEKDLLVWIDEDPRQKEPAATLPLNYNFYKPGRPDQVFPTEPGIFVRVEERLPHVHHRDSYDPTGKGDETALEMELSEDGTVSDRFFLPLNQGFSLDLLQMRLMPLLDAAFDNLVAPAGNHGTLRFRIDGQELEVDIEKELNQPRTIAGRQVIAREYIEDPHGADVGPIAVFDLTQDGKTETYYVSALRPDRSPMRKSDGQHAAEIGVRLAVNLRSSALWFVKTETALRCLALSANGSKRELPVKIGEPLRYPFMQVPLDVRPLRLVESAERVPMPTKPRKDDQMRPAVRVKVSRGQTAVRTWVKFEPDPRSFTTVDLGGERVMLAFRPRQRKLDFSVRLERLKVPLRPGTQQPAKYESDITIFDPRVDGGIPCTTGVNYPATHRGFVFYQASVSKTQEGGRFDVSVFQVAWDPGKRILYLGGIMAISGTLFMMFLKPFLGRLMKRAKDAKDLPFGDAEIIVALTLLSIGTLTGSAMMFARSTWSGVALGFFVAGIDVIAAVVGCFMAWGRTPARGVQLGQALATTWCLNTAALVLFMWVKVLG